MRLIDADYLKEVLNSGTGEAVEIKISKSMPLEKIVDIVIHAYRECLFAELEKVPTAYDVDKVVRKLEKGIEESALVTLKAGFDVAIEIVKSGGIGRKEEKNVKASHGKYVI